MEPKECFPMRRILILATAILGIAFPVFAQQGPALPSEDSPQKDRSFPRRGLIVDPHFQSLSPLQNPIQQTGQSLRLSKTRLTT